MSNCNKTTKPNPKIGMRDCSSLRLVHSSKTLYVAHIGKSLIGKSLSLSESCLKKENLPSFSF
jgi:hypothetical protein